MKWIISLYPPEWRRRYRDEMLEQLDAGPSGFRTTLDLIAGAVDAWRNRDLITEAIREQGNKNMIISSRAEEFGNLTRTDEMKGAAWTIGITLLLVAIGVALDKTLGDNAFASALIFSSCLFGLGIAGRLTFLKPYSAQARNVISNSILSMALLVFLMVFVLL